MDLVKLHIWHGGEFRKDPKLTYVGGEVVVFDEIDPDELCYFWLEEMALSCGQYTKIEELYFLVPGLSLEVGLRKIYNDKEVVEMTKYVIANGFVQLFVVHALNLLPKSQQPQNIECENSLLKNNISFQCSKNKLAPIRATNANTNQTQPKPAVIATNKSIIDDLYDDRPDSPLRYKDLVSDVDESDDPTYYPDNDDDTDGEWHEDFVVDDLVNDGDDGVCNIKDAIQEEIQDHVIEADSDTSDDEPKVAREKINLWNKKIMEIAVELQKDAEDERLKGQNKPHDIRVESGCVSEYEDSNDEILTPGESEEDDTLGKKRRDMAPLIDEFTDFSKLNWKVGMKFENRQKFKDAVTRYSIIQGRHLTFKVSSKNRQQRLGVKCQDGCPFKLYGSWDTRRVCFVVKSVDDKHKCNRNMKRNRQMKSTWLAEQFLEVFKSRPHWPANEICETVRRAYKVIVERGFAYKIKYWAHKKLHGSMKDHYNKVGRYVEALKERSPNCVFKIQTDHLLKSSPPVFKRFFVCFDALSEGWLDGCRKVICLDGCFLKTFLGGMLLAAVGRDANDQMYPIAWAVVEGENNDSWEWFLTELRSCLHERNEGDMWTFISDQQKGIINAVASVFGKAEHRNCARHVFANWHKTYKGDELKGLFWKAARAYNEADYNLAIEELDSVNPAACIALKAQNPKTSCRAFVDTHTKCDVIVNNMAETFNGYIIHARTKHLLYMLEDIRTTLMQRLNNKKLEMEKDDSLLCPRIQAKLDKEKLEIGECTPMPSNETLFQVIHKLDNLAVDLQLKTCACRKWQLTGIPCCHALTCIYFKREEAEPYVDECYRRETYLKSYLRPIQPCNGEKYWPKVDMAIDPSYIKVGPGRPRRNRRKDPHENPKKSGRLTRYGTVMTCSVCNSTEHTKRKCPDKDKDKANDTRTQTKRGRGRPRKFEDTRPRQGQSVTANSLSHHNASAEPSRIGRGGKTITRGRGSRRGQANRGGRGRTVPTGFGVYVAENGATIINNPGQVAPTLLSQGINNNSSFLLSSQASVNNLP